MLGNLIKSTALKFSFIWTMVILIKIRIICDATKCTISQRVNSDGDVLEIEVQKAS